jgi:hypothetical protein
MNIGVNMFEFNGVWIENPYLSECGRFEVDPKEYYGIDVEELNDE